MTQTEDLKMSHIDKIKELLNTNYAHHVGTMDLSIAILELNERLKKIEELATKPMFHGKPMSEFVIMEFLKLVDKDIAELRTMMQQLSPKYVRPAVSGKIWVVSLHSVEEYKAGRITYDQLQGRAVLVGEPE